MSLIKRLMEVYESHGQRFDRVAAEEYTVKYVDHWLKESKILRNENTALKNENTSLKVQVKSLQTQLLLLNKTLEVTAKVMGVVFDEEKGEPIDDNQARANLC
ncbi:MAG: hypothetical protein IJ459_01960 [Clostridia bacterium]|nr:hypothetical protein [Clostridia bacterium]